MSIATCFFFNGSELFLDKSGSFVPHKMLRNGGEKRRKFAVATFFNGSELLCLDSMLVPHNM